MTEIPNSSINTQQLNEVGQRVANELAGSPRAVISDLPVGIGKHPIFIRASAQTGATKCLVITHAIELQSWAASIQRFDPQATVQLLKRVEPIDPNAKWVLTTAPVAGRGGEEIMAAKFDTCVIDIAPIEGGGFMKKFRGAIFESIKSINTVWMPEQMAPKKNNLDTFSFNDFLRRQTSEENELTPGGG